MAVNGARIVSVAQDGPTTLVVARIEPTGEIISINLSGKYTEADLILAMQNKLQIYIDQQESRDSVVSTAIVGRLVPPVPKFVP